MAKSEIRAFIREEIVLIFENFEFNDSQKLKKFNPTDNMKKNVLTALEAIKKNDLTNKGGNEGSGKLKAISIKNEEPINFSMLKRMKAFFDNNQIKYNTDKSSGKTINDSGIIQTWNLWGGDAGKKFANDNIKSLNKSNLDRKKNRKLIDTGKTKSLMNPFNYRNK